MPVPCIVSSSSYPAGSPPAHLIFTPVVLRRASLLSQNPAVPCRFQEQAPCTLHLPFATDPLLPLLLCTHFFCTHVGPIPVPDHDPRLFCLHTNIQSFPDGMRFSSQCLVLMHPLVTNEPARSRRKQASGHWRSAAAWPGNQAPRARPAHSVLLCALLILISPPLAPLTILRRGAPSAWPRRRQPSGLRPASRSRLCLERTAGPAPAPP